MVCFKVDTEKPPSISFEALCNRNAHTRWTLDMDGGGDGETVVVLCAERTAQQKRASSGVEAGGEGANEMRNEREGEGFSFFLYLCA